MSYKVILAHPERQHSFKLASALKKNDMLCKYVTTVYNKDSSILMRFTKVFLSKENIQRANNRRNADLDNDDVIQFCELRGLLQVWLYRFDKSKRIYNWWHKKTSKAFGKKVAKLAIKEKADAVILYDANAYTCFDILSKKAPSIVRIMDTSAANRLYMKTIYEKDMKLCPNFADRLKREREFLWRSNYCDLLLKEIEATQYFFVPSSFVKKSLMFSGVTEDRIYLCPYGTNFTVVSSGKKNVVDSRPIRAVFVGNVTEMKGIYYLLEAVMQIPKEQLTLTLVGAYENDDGVFNKYLSRVSFTGRITHDAVRDVLLTSDIFVFPSLGEGMSLSVLEALACGLPCIVSENSGVSELIINKENGFVIEPQNTVQIVDKLLWFINNKDHIASMSESAISSAKIYSWEQYNTNVCNYVRDIINKQ